MNDELERLRAQRAELEAGRAALRRERTREGIEVEAERLGLEQPRWIGAILVDEMVGVDEDGRVDPVEAREQIMSLVRVMPSFAGARPSSSSPTNAGRIIH